jgi:hypothetical protein
VQSISPTAGALSAPFTPDVGTELQLYFVDFGLLSGRVGRLLDFGFAVELEGSAEDRVKVATKIK